ncbi:MAG: endonuclease/exonuclease/phosphatase family protein [Candidatus Brocadiaceae bacterium]|nr:endonuclease/exonuclease/phosphatase family protein [Candidatus Brocadiaceae bacterium]
MIKLSKPRINLTRHAIGFIAFFILVSSSSLAWSQVQCTDIAIRGELNVLTINLLFSEVKNREVRLNAIANFIAEQTNEGRPIDVVLLQEVVGGKLSGTINSSMDLQRLLAETGLQYNLSYTKVNGIPELLWVGNAILSRCEILFTISRILPFESEEPFEGFEILLKRKVMMSRVNIPGFGRINIYNTHLCAYCDTAERLEQTNVLMRFIKNVEGLIPAENPIILGGDFNIDLNIANNDSTYNLITGGGFSDTYGEFNSCATCCSVDEGFAGCTFAVLGNPYATNPFTGQKEEPARIDYIFVKGIGIGESGVVFNSSPLWVSDHSGVVSLGKFILP